MSILKIRDENGEFKSVLAINGKDGISFPTIEVPEGEVSPTSIYELGEGVWYLKGKFHYYPLDFDTDDGYYYNPVITFTNGVIAYVTKSKEGETVYNTHLWYFDAAMDGNIGAQVIITVTHDSEYDGYDNSFSRIHNSDLEYSTFKHEEINTQFYSRLNSEMGRKEFYPTIGVMADYIDDVMGEILDELHAYAQTLIGGET